MAAISDADVSIDSSGNIRWTGAATTNRHTVLEFIQWLQDKQDDGQAAGDDILDITVDTPFERSTDQILTLNWPFNIDDTFASHLYDGSVQQALDANNTLGERWSGLEVLGPVETGTEYMILQAGRVLPAFWGTGINAPGGSSLVFSRHLVKSYEGGAAIDGGRITVLARTLSDQYRRFPVTLGLANSVAAIGNGPDVFNTSSDATLAAITDITNTEGFQELDIDGTGAAGQEYYSQWTDGANTTNDVYEYGKFITQNAHTTDATGGTPSGTDFVIEDGTTTGQAQSFIPSSVSEYLTEARFQIKIGAGTPTGTIYAELWDSDDAGSQLAEPTGGALARSEDILASAITSSYEEVIFRFNRKDPTGTITAQDSQLVLDNAEYFIVLRHDAGDGSNYFHVEGANTDQDSTMNQASDASGTWTAVATNDLNLIVKSSPHIHGIAGETFEGISVEVGYDTETGTEIAEDDIVVWGTEVTIDNLSGTFIEGEHVNIKADGGSTVKNGGQVLFADSTEMIIALDDITSNLLDNDDITGVTSGATAKIATTITNQDKSGGSGLVLARDDNSGTGELYLQLITGVNPVENSRIYKPGDVANYVEATSTINVRTISPEFLGTSTGSNIIGAYGIGYVPAEVGASDRFTDLSNTSRVPPNNVVFTVSGLVSGEDRVLVGPRTGTSLDRGQWLVATALDDGIAGTPETQLVVKTGTDTVPFPDAEENWPDTGIGTDNSRLRIELDTSGRYARIPYDSHDGTDTFTLGTPTTGAIDIDVTGGNTFTRVSAGSFLDDGFEPGCVFTGTNFANGGNNSQFVVSSVTATTIVPTDSTGMVNESGTGDETLTSDGWEFNNGDSSTDFYNASVDNNVFLAFIDVLADATTETFTGVHGGTDRDLFVRVRDGGGTPIKTFESDSAQFLSTPQTVAAVRTPDV